RVETGRRIGDRAVTVVRQAHATEAQRQRVAVVGDLIQYAGCIPTRRARAAELGVLPPLRKLFVAGRIVDVAAPLRGVRLHHQSAVAVLPGGLQLGRLALSRP